MSQRIIETPWGGFQTLILNTKCTVKILRLKAGHRTSLQYHKNRTEFFNLISGNCKIQVVKQIIKLTTDYMVWIPKGKAHRITAITNSTVLEISIGTFNEQDITRIQDDYGR